MSYEIDKDFKIAGMFSLGNIKFTNKKFKLANKFAAYTVKHVKLDKDIITKEYNMDGVRVTMYTANKNYGVSPCLVYFHGGAFVMSSLGYQRQIASMYAKEAGYKVFFVEYTTLEDGKEFKVLDEGYKVLKYISKNYYELKVDKECIVLGGDSAGGNIAEALSYVAADKKSINVLATMLIYPVLDKKQETASMREYIDTPIWNARLNKQMWEMLFRNVSNKDKKYFSVIDIEKENRVLKTYIEVEEFDCLRDEGIIYAKKQEESGKVVYLHKNKGLFHCFDLMLNKPRTKEIIKKRSKFLKNINNF